MAERGSGSTILCPGCGEQHRAVYRLEGLPVLDCPSIETPGELRMRRVPRSVHVTSFLFLRGPEHAPADADMPAPSPTAQVVTVSENVDTNNAGELVKTEPHTTRRRTA